MGSNKVPVSSMRISGLVDSVRLFCNMAESNPFAVVEGRSKNLLHFAWTVFSL